MDDQAGTLLTGDHDLTADGDLSGHRDLTSDHDLSGEQDLAEDELLVEEISIDGMCGVY